jgi:hypothetical protein
VLTLTDGLEPELWWMDFDGWVDAWIVYMGVEGEGFAAVVQFEDSDNPESLDNPVLTGIWFETLTYEEWHEAKSAEAVAAAFRNPEVASLVRPHAGWAGSAELPDANEDTIWLVSFVSGEEQIAYALVNVATGDVLDYGV